MPGCCLECYLALPGVTLSIFLRMVPPCSAAACANLARLTNEMCLGETPFEQSQEITRSTARLVQQRNMQQHPAGQGILARALGGLDRGQGRPLLAVTLCTIVLRYLRVRTRGPRGYRCGMPMRCR